VIVLSERTLRAAGLDAATAIGLMQPAEGELVVIINNVHDRISSPVVAEEPEATERLHAENLKTAGFDGGGVRHTYRASEPGGDELPTIAPTQPHGVSTRPALPASLEDIQAASQTAAHRLGIPRLPERGVTFRDLQHVAAALGVEVTLLPGDAVRLQGKFGKGEYGTFASAAAALNARTYTPGGT
jgi:hypothetical protein